MKGSVDMSEIKNNKEIILSNINDYVKSFVGSIIQHTDSIETYPLYLYSFDLLIVHLCGILELKYRALCYIKADVDLDEKYILYVKSNTTSVDFKELINYYKNEYSKSINNAKDKFKADSTDIKKLYDNYICSTTEYVFDIYNIKYNKKKQNKCGYKEFRNIVLNITDKNINNSIKNEDIIVYKLHDDFKNIYDFIDSIKEGYLLNVKLGNIYSKFEKGKFYSKIKEFYMNKGEYRGVYDILLDTYKCAYKYRHTIAHNINFGYKANSMDFNSLKSELSTDNIFEYLYAIMVADRIIISIYNNIEMRRMI